MITEEYGDVMATGQLSTAEIEDALRKARELSITNRDDNGELSHELSGGEVPIEGGSHMDLAGNPMAGIVGGGLPGMEAPAVEQYEVPDNCVGLIIGRGGESISNIENQTGCRVQMSQTPYNTADGQTMRTCQLTGLTSSVQRAKDMIQGIVDKSGGTPPPNRNIMGGLTMSASGGRVITHEMLIPATKCGLVIGKGGETIKQLQDKAQVKMVMIQDTNHITGLPKPLRIIGEPDKVEFAKQLVEEVMSSKDDGKSAGITNDYGSGFMPKAVGEVMIIVPRSAVGVIIGRGGENIRRLTQDTGAKIQFKPDEPHLMERTAVITGTPDQIQKATQLITDMVNRAVAGAGDGIGAGGGGPFRKASEADVFYMQVSSTKTGLVIGKGGETIKQICAESGARVELSRDPPPNEFEKIFIIRGTPQQIHHAQHLIRTKVGDMAANTPVPPFSGADQQFNYPTSYGSPTMGDPNSAALAAYWSQYYQQNTASQNFSASAAGIPAQPAQSTNASTAPNINPQTGQPDYSAQWAEYYRSLGMHDQAVMIEQQARANQQNVAAAVSSAQPAPVSAQNFGYGQQSQYGYGPQPTASAPTAASYQFPGQY